MDIGTAIVLASIWVCVTGIWVSKYTTGMTASIASIVGIALTLILKFY